MTEQGKKKEPIHKIQRGSIEAAVWENTTNLESGKTRTWYSVQIHRRYKTDDGKYRETNSYALADLVQVAHIARLAEEWVNRHAEAPTSSAANDGGEQYESPVW
jgi:hypothetical protein